MKYQKRLEKIKQDIMKKKYPVSWTGVEEILTLSSPRDIHTSSFLYRANNFSDILKKIDITIESDQLFAGSIEPAFTGSYDLYSDSQYFLAGREGKRLKSFLASDIFDKKLQESLTKSEKIAAEEMIAIGKRVSGHAVPDFKKVLCLGMEGIIFEIEKYKSNIEDKEKKLFYEGCLISCRALINHALRYADMAEKKALEEIDPGRKKELVEISRICRKVPKHPAESFREALQSFWFVYVAMHLEQFPNPYAFSVGRFDSFMLPFFQKDFKKGVIDKETTLELLGCLWLKFMFSKHAWAVSQNILLGGKNSNCVDKDRLLTRLCIEITSILKTPQPSVAFRYHEGEDDSVFYDTLKLVRTGTGMPSFHNDESIINSMVNAGIKRKDAVDYAIAGCQEPVVQGKENGRTTAGKFNLLKCLEVTLNDGKTSISGRQVGLENDYIKNVKTYDQFYREFLRQVDYIFEIMVSAHNKSDHLLAKYKPVPFLSCIMDDCLEKGIDFRADGARYNSSGVLVHGFGSTVDSLAVIKKIIFEEKEYPLQEFSKILRDDFKNNKILQNKLLRKIPKFGDDDDYVDNIAGLLMHDFIKITEKYRNHFNGTYRIGFNTPSIHILYGKKTGATPDGRRSSEPFSYGTGPAKGRCRKGPTAILNSMAKLPQEEATLGTDLSLSVNSMNIKTEENLKKIGTLVKTYFKKGGHHVMFNIISRDTLIAAQKKPEEYEDLVVRVHGYSSYFTSLIKEIQDELIERVECGL